MKTLDAPRAISLFSGCGGMDVGFAAAGFDVVWANEINKHAVATYRLNHPNSEMVDGDVNEHLDNIPKDVDCVFGGPPCQCAGSAGM